MKHVTFSDKSLLIGDEAVSVLLEYAAELGRRSLADTVKLNAISADGDDVVAEFLLNSGSPLMAETSNTTAPEPDNDDAIRDMRTRLRLLTNPPNVLAEDQSGALDFDQPGPYDE